MPITLSPATQKLLHDHLACGEYASVDDLLHAALKALDEQKAFLLDDATLAAIDRSEDQIDRSEVHALDNLRERIRARFCRP
jgi:Arc/MetJ-type ribon-helix-helix transcriptional regulator